jgi:hypothetical protein
MVRMMDPGGAGRRNRHGMREGLRDVLDGRIKCQTANLRNTSPRTIRDGGRSVFGFFQGRESCRWIAL